MSKVHLVIPDAHAHPDFHNKRFGYLGQLVRDVKPDTVIDIGDWADMPSLCEYEKGKGSFQSRRYAADIQASHDAEDRFWSPIREAKRALPRFVRLRGNHEQRIARAISLDPVKLEGIISLTDLDINRNWEIVPYNGATPGIINIDGINYAHYFTSGVMGRPISGERPAHQLLQKQYESCVQGHAHVTDYCVRTNARGKHIHGLVVGVYQDYFADYAGAANDLWWRGVLVLRNVDGGRFDPQWISLDALKKTYG